MNEDFFVVYAGSVVRICALVLLGIPVVRWCSNICIALCKKRFSQHIGILAGHIVFYGGLIFIGVTILHEFGFNVTALLGAAGVLGVAIGFASQTSISNIISGFFLLMERPFSVSDIIKSGEVVGVVESIDLLSVRVRTLDNKMVRLPNETVLKQALTNLTFYPVKRIDCIVSVAYTDNVTSAMSLIHGVITSNPLFLVSPVPIVMINRIEQHEFSAEMRLFITVRVWVAKQQFSSAPAVLMQNLKAEFDKNKSVITAVQIN